MISYHQFIGQDVTWHKVNELEDGTAEITEGSGTVAGIQFKEDQVIILLDDGTELEPANISQVNETVKESVMMQASMMIGKMVSYMNDQQEEVEATVQSVSFNKGKTSFHLNDGTSTILSPSQIIKISNIRGLID